MSRTMGDLADELVSIIGFGVTDAKALEWINAAQKLMIARAKAMRRTLDGITTDGTGTVETPLSVVELYWVRIDGVSYQKVPRDTMEALRADDAVLSFPGLAYAVEADTSGVPTFEVYPAPDAGLDVECFAAVVPDGQVAADTPHIPDEYVDALVEKGAARGYAYVPEQLGAADRFEARFDATCQEYSRRVARQWRGSGPTQIRVVGLNA